MNKRTVAVIRCLFVLCFSATANCATPPQTPLRIAVAANFKPLLQQLLVKFNRQTQINSQLISGSTGTLYQQIKHGAPFDLFLAADTIRPQQLQQDGLIVPNSLATYAIGRIALYHSSDSAYNFDDLARVEGRLAIANPLISPYGIAAKQTLQSLGLWNKYKDRLITSHNITQTLQQIRSKAVNFGIVAFNQLQLLKLSGLLIPQRHHQVIKQQLVIIKSSRQVANAKRFSEFLRSEVVQNIIGQAGYGAISTSSQTQGRQGDTYEH